VTQDDDQHRTADDTAVSADAPREPDTYVQGEAVTLLSVLDAFARLGFTGQFDTPAGAIRCLQCRQETPAADVDLEELRRLEGASDPADMLAVAALRCPHCGAQGTLVLNYGPEATPEDAEVLGALPEPG
jgi:hypothetical protein